MVLDAGSHEELKGALHGGASGLVALFALYNVAAWLRRREPHLALNAAVYALATAWEVHKTVEHLRNTR